MHTAIAITLLFAGLTSALGAQLQFRRLRGAISGRVMIALAVSAGMALWFIIAAYWSITQAYPGLALQ